MTTKASRIRDLYAQGKTVAQIAEIIGCRREYVRVCARQRASGATGKADIAYWKKRYKVDSIVEAWRLRGRERYADPAYRPKHRGYVAAYRRRQVERQTESG